MDHIHLQHTLPQVFAARDTVISQVWHQDIVFDKGKRYLIEASSGTGKSSCAAISTGIGATTRASSVSTDVTSAHSPSANGQM